MLRSAPDRLPPWFRLYSFACACLAAAVFAAFVLLCAEGWMTGDTEVEAVAWIALVVYGLLMPAATVLVHGAVGRRWSWPRLPGALRAAVGRSVQLVLARLAPRRQLLVAAVLVLASLPLATTVDGCGRPQPGYRVVTGSENWGTATVDAPQWRIRSTRVAYCAALALAALSLAVGLWPARAHAPDVVRRRGSRVLFGLTLFTGLFLYADLPCLFVGASSIGWQALALCWLSVFWMLPVFFWLRFGAKRQPPWDQILPWQMRLLAPVGLPGLFVLGLAVSFKLAGMVVFYLGLAGMLDASGRLLDAEYESSRPADMAAAAAA